MTSQVSVIDPHESIFTISVAANLAGMHPQTLRTYDRLGLVRPKRTRERGRRYSPSDVARLRLVQRLSQDEGINLNGIERILAMDAQIERLQSELEQVSAQRDEAVALAQQVAGSGFGTGAMANRVRVFTAGPSGAVKVAPDALEPARGDARRAGHRAAS